MIAPATAREAEAFRRAYAKRRAKRRAADTVLAALIIAGAVLPVAVWILYGPIC